MEYPSVSPVYQTPLNPKFMPYLLSRPIPVLSNAFPPLSPWSYLMGLCEHPAARMFVAFGGELEVRGLRFIGCPREYQYVELGEKRKGLA